MSAGPAGDAAAAAREQAAMQIFDDLVECVETDIGRHDQQKIWHLLTAGKDGELAANQVKVNEEAAARLRAALQRLRETEQRLKHMAAEQAANRRTGFGMLDAAAGRGDGGGGRSGPEEQPTHRDVERTAAPSKAVVPKPQPIVTGPRGPAAKGRGGGEEAAAAARLRAEAAELQQQVQAKDQQLLELERSRAAAVDSVRQELSGSIDTYKQRLAAKEAEVVAEAGAAKAREAELTAEIAALNKASSSSRSSSSSSGGGGDSDKQHRAELDTLQAQLDAAVVREASEAAAAAAATQAEAALVDAAEAAKLEAVQAAAHVRADAQRQRASLEEQLSAAVAAAATSKAATKQLVDSAQRESDGAERQRVAAVETAVAAERTKSAEQTAAAVEAAVAQAVAAERARLEAASAAAVEAAVNRAVGAERARAAESAAATTQPKAAKSKGPPQVPGSAKKKGTPPPVKKKAGGGAPPPVPGRAGGAAGGPARTVSLIGETLAAAGEAGAAGGQAPTEPLGRVQAVPVFQTIVEHKAAMSALADKLRPVAFAAGAVVISKGGVDTEMYFVVAGGVDIHVELAVPPVAQLGPGRYFGEGALVTAEPRTAFVVAATDVELLVLTRADVQQILLAHPDAEQMYKLKAR
eukprot:SAG22_NODE_2058_length_3066_cov_3.101112_1_plen_638_part_00